MNRSGMLLIAVLIGFTAFLGCARPFPPPKIALLPFDNETNNLDAPDQVREVLQDELQEMKYNLVSLADVDSHIKNLGISDGGQLPSVPIEDLRKGIETDYFVYGILNDYGFKSLIVWTQAKVALSATIKQTCNQRKVFEGSGGASVNHFGATAVANTVAHPVAQMARTLTGSKMKYATLAHQAVEDLIRKFPKNLRQRRRIIETTCP